MTMFFRMATFSACIKAATMRDIIEGLIGAALFNIPIFWALFIAEI